MKKNIFAYSMIAMVVIINIISIVVFKEINILALIASISGVASAVLSAKGHINCYYIGLINIVSYVVVAFYSHFYGTLLLQLLFFIPMQFIGIYHWKKHLKPNTKIVNTKEMTLNQIILTTLLSVAVALLYSMFLRLIGSHAVILDSSITTMSIIGTVLSIRRYKEQWLFWSIVNILSILMWSTSASNNHTGILMATTYVIYLINSVYGYINWKSLLGTQEEIK